MLSRKRRRRKEALGEEEVDEHWGKEGENERMEKKTKITLGKRERKK